LCCGNIIDFFSLLHLSCVDQKQKPCVSTVYGWWGQWLMKSAWYMTIGWPKTTEAVIAVVDEGYRHHFSFTCEKNLDIFNVGTCCACRSFWLYSWVSQYVSKFQFEVATPEIFLDGCYFSHHKVGNEMRVRSCLIQLNSTSYDEFAVIWVYFFITTFKVMLVKRYFKFKSLFFY